MTNDNTDIRDLLAAVALGAATPEEEARVEAAVQGDAGLAEELAGLRAASSTLALSVTQVEPPPSLKMRLMDEVRAEAVAAPAPPARRRSRKRFVFLRPAPWPAFAAVAAVAVGLLVWNISLQSSSDPAPELRSIALRGTDVAPDIRGRALFVADEDTAVVSLASLPPLDSGEGYELWVIRDGKPASAGFLSMSGGREAVIAVNGVRGAEALAVTPEPLTNTTAPTAPIVAQVAL
jgi:anti-sigma-K factor RskA